MTTLPGSPDVVVAGDCQCTGGQPKNFVLPCLLLLLREGPAHGYDLVNRLVPFGFSSDPPVVYRNLRRMESDRLVESSWDTSGKGPARRVYELTDRGISHLESWTIAIKYQRDVLNTFLNRHEDDIVGQTPSSASHERRAIPAGS
ncbi:MAG TPA: helix-turn-helix transcriptional regulator [Chloroflexota bacterium]